MGDMTPTAVTDGTAATAAVITANIAELETINGSLEAANLEATAEVSKDKHRQGCVSRHMFVSALVNQKLTVGAAGAGADLITGQEFFVAGQVAQIVLPPGTWSIIVSFQAAEVFDRLVHRFDGGAWVDMDWAAYPNQGSFLLLYPPSTQRRVVDVAVRYIGVAGVMDFGEQVLLGIEGIYWGHHISLSAFRSG